MKKEPLQPSQLPVVLCCPGPHLWCSMLPKPGTQSLEIGAQASPTEGSKSVSHPHRSSLHFFVLLEVSSVRSGGKNHFLTANGAVAFHSSAGYSIGTGWISQRSIFLVLFFFLFFSLQRTKIMQFPEHGVFWSILKRVMLVAVIQDLSVLPLRRSTWTASSAQLLLLCTHY